MPGKLLLSYTGPVSLFYEDTSPVGLGLHPYDLINLTLIPI
jgi:hypothetical protein